MNPIEMQGFATMTDKKTSMLTIASLLAGGALVILAFTKRKAIMAAANEGITTIKASAKGVADKMSDGLIKNPIPAVTGGLNDTGENPMHTPGH